MSFFNNNNNNANRTGFGGSGFGGPSNNTGGFGANNNTASSSGLFGGNTATSGSVFGGGFGSNNNNNNNNSPFGANKTGFGASNPATGGGNMFGANTGATGGLGGFGSTANTGGAFGGTTSAAGLFGQNKAATSGFGASNNAGSIFGGGANTTGGFGANNNNNNNNNAASNPFGANNNTGFGASNANTGGGFGFGATPAAATNNNGTASQPFQAFSEKDATSDQTSYYQSITFQQPYTTRSFEELRTEDYAQGRKYGNTNGQAGSFGQSTGFGGFAQANPTNASTGMFGGNTANTGNTGFGGGGGFGANNNNNNTTSAFGTNNAAGGLFSQNKPAGTSLFGGAASGTATSGFGNTAAGGTTGGLFSNNTGGGFGSAPNNNASTGLFQNANQNQAKPAFGNFGSTNTGGGFGASTNTGGGNLFGGNNQASTGLFGANNNNQQQQQPQNNSLFGANQNTGTSNLFGNQNKPAGSMFGASTNNNVGGGLLGANNQQPQNNAFGASTNTTGLFGAQNQNKPATTGLFGASANTNAGSIFGGANNQQPGASIFGGNANTGNSIFGDNANKQASTGLFGGGNNNTSGTGMGLSLFNNNNQQQNQQNTGSNMFGALNQSQPQQNNNANSLFASMNQNNNQAAQQHQLHASLTNAPYGNEQLFSSLAAPSPPVGPLVTPLNGGRQALRKTQSLLSSAKVATPIFSIKGGSLGRTGGYGFSYSTYGTPGSAYTSGSLTPGASSLLRPTGSFSSALASRLGKSYSTSNLRGDAASPDTPSLLRSGSVTSGMGAYGSGSMRKLTVDRSLRVDLFGPQSKQIDALKDNEGPTLSKRVSFTNEVQSDPATPDPSSQNALVRTEDSEGREDDSPGLLRAGPPKTIETKAPEMEQVSSALASVPEDGGETPRLSSAPQSKALTEPATRTTAVGEYWTKPALKDLKNMSRQQLQNVGKFTVGREGIGRIEFGRVDLTSTVLDDICDNIVQLIPRSATVYQDDKDKPSMGKALNVPATIFLENSWPRSHGGKKATNARGGKEYDKHIARLKRVGGTHFVDYDPDTGVWCFKVDHFTTYGLEEEDESDYVDDSRVQHDSSGLSDPPETPLGERDATMQSVETGPADLDDTFQFRLDRRSQASLPGGFGSESMIFDNDLSADEAAEVEEHMMSGGLGDEEMEDPFTSPGGAVQAPSPGAIERYQLSLREDGQEAADDQDSDEEDVDQDIPGSFIEAPKMPRSILKPSTAFSAFTSPEKLATETWEEQLQRTMSPKKRDRQVLKDMQQDLLLAWNEEGIESPFKQSLLGQSALGQSYLAQKSAKKAKLTASGGKSELGKSQAFRTAMDLMDSMYAQEKTGRKAGASAKGLQSPVPKTTRPSNLEEPRSLDPEWHNTVKPSFAANGCLVYSVPGSAPRLSDGLVPAIAPLVGEHKDVRFAKFEAAWDVKPPVMDIQFPLTTIDIEDDFPIARTERGIVFENMVTSFEDNCTPLEKHEQSMWRLCSLLFNRLSLVCPEYVVNMSETEIRDFSGRIQIDAIGAFWSQLVARLNPDGLKRCTTAEERALLRLTRNDVAGACQELVDARDFRLATLVAQLPGSERSRGMMKKQIETWRNRNDWSEMSEPVRALYSILAGEVCTVQGKTGAAENRVAEFCISERFGLSWQESFALRLYYHGHEAVSDVVKAYNEDLEAGRERVQPITTHANGETTVDTFLEILRIVVDATDTAVMFNPLAVSGSAVNSRLTWQLATTFGAGDHVCAVPDAQLDQLSYNYACELEAAGWFVPSAWVLLHLSDPVARRNAVSALLERNGGKISTPEWARTPGSEQHSDCTEQSYETLTEQVQIPATLLWRAKALYAQAGLNSPHLQAAWLLHAGDDEEAHHVLCRAVGPKSVVERRYDELDRLLQNFPAARPSGWNAGGQVYADFLRLLKSQTSQEREGAEVNKTLRRFKRGLAGMEDGEGADKRTLEEKVAGLEMRKLLVELEKELGGRVGDVKMGGVNHGEGGENAAWGIDLLGKYRAAMGVVA